MRNEPNIKYLLISVANIQALVTTNFPSSNSTSAKAMFHACLEAAGLEFKFG